VPRLVRMEAWDRWCEAESGCCFRCGHQNRDFLPLLHLIRRLSKGPFPIHDAAHWGHLVAMKPPGFRHRVSATVNIPSYLLYDMSIEELAQKIEANLWRQHRTAITIVDRLGKPRRAKEAKA